MDIHGGINQQNVGGIQPAKTYFKRIVICIPKHDMRVS